jgi:hypothetical protein
MSYHTLYVAMLVIFCTLIALWALSEFAQWRMKRMLPKWLARDMRRMYIDAEPEPDSRSSLETFAKIVPGKER